MGHDTVHSTAEGPDVRDLAKVALGKWSVAILILSLTIFLPAGSLTYWEGFVYIALMAVPSLTFIVLTLRRDPELLARRMRMREKEHEQRRIVKLAYPIFVAGLILPGLDHRFGWSDIPVWAVLTADVVIFLGYLLFVRVLLENRYASRTVEVEADQRVITTGPYAVVRHPMYVAVLMIYLATPFALGSAWAELVWIWLVAFLVARIRNEEQVLEAGLPGYGEYMRATRFRLIPGVW